VPAIKVTASSAVVHALLLPVVTTQSTSDAQVKVTLSLANDLILATDETLQVSANGTDWVVTTGSNKAWV
jgi:hypothetical protein